MDPQEAITLGVVVARLDDLREDFAAFRTEFRESQKNTVPRPEYEEHKAHVEKRFQDQGQDISDIRADMASRKAPWWATASVIIAGLAVAWNILMQLTKGA